MATPVLWRQRQPSQVPHRPIDAQHRISREFGADAATQMRVVAENHPEGLEVETVKPRQAPAPGAAVERLMIFLLAVAPSAVRQAPRIQCGEEVVISVMATFHPSARSFDLDATSHAALIWCSRRDAGWRSTLLRHFQGHPIAEDVQLPALDDHLLVLVTAGRADVEASSDGVRWRHSRHVCGRLAMTAPGRDTRLRWSTTSTAALETLHLYVPGRALQDVAEQAWDRTLDVSDLPDTLGTTDALVEETMLAMARAAKAGVGELYAESALHLLAVHLLTKPGAAALPPAPVAGRRPDARIQRSVAYMHGNLAMPLSLSDLANVAELSPYHFLRLFRDTLGEPPHRHLTRLRVAAARRQLERTNLPVSDIAYLCGFSSPSHFAAAFRRSTGGSPTSYRGQHRTQARKAGATEAATSPAGPLAASDNAGSTVF